VAVLCNTSGFGPASGLSEAAVAALGPLAERVRVLQAGSAASVPNSFEGSLEAAKAQARRTGVALLLQRAFAALFACGMCWALRGRRHGHGCETASGRSKQGAEITTWPGLVAIAFTVNIYIFREQLHLASVLRPAIVVQ